MKKKASFGGIVKYKLGGITGYGFKIVFSSSEEAQRYKEMMGWILESDNYKLKDQVGYYGGR